MLSHAAALLTPSMRRLILEFDCSGKASEDIFPTTVRSFGRSALNC
jgi:hypothetical protein